MKRLFILSILLAFDIMPLFAQSGKLGETVRWELKPDGVLVIVGNENIPDVRKPTRAPFLKAKICNLVNAIDLTQYSGYIGKYVFYGIPSVKSVKICAEKIYYFDSLSFDPTFTIDVIEILPSRYLKGDYRLRVREIPQSEQRRSPGLVILAKKTNDVIFVKNYRKQNLQDTLMGFLRFNEATTSDIKYKSFISSGVWKGKTMYKYQWDDSTWWVGEKKETGSGFGASYNNVTWNGGKELRVRVGNWKDWKLQGYGMNVWFKKSDTTIYVGNYENGVRGKGYCRRINPTYYGSFHNVSVTYGNEHGKWEYDSIGIWKYNDGKIEYGKYDDNVFQGHPESVPIETFFDFPDVLPFDIIARNYIEQKVSQWQKKDEFETTPAWQQRVNEDSRKQKALQLLDEVHDLYLADAASKTDLCLSLGPYDADNRTFLVRSKIGDCLVSIVDNVMSPQFFKSNFNDFNPVPTYTVNNNTLCVEQIDFVYRNRIIAKYDITSQLRYNYLDIEYNLEPLDIPLSGVTLTQRQIIDTLQNSLRDKVDTEIPETSRQDKKTYAFVIANENYSFKKVPYALNDGRVFAEYCIKTLGLTKEHVITYENATSSKIIECVEMMKSASKANHGDINIIFYYAGHAFPDEETNSPYLLPIDGNYQVPRTCYSLQQLYKDLNGIESHSVVCFIDACFSGATRENEVLLAGRGVARRVNNDVPSGNVIVFTASTGAETAHQYTEKKHGLFTYYLLKKLQDTRGNVTLGELSLYLINNITKTSFDKNRKTQTPTVISSPTIIDTWQDIRL